MTISGEDIQKALEYAFKGGDIRVQDDSHLHQGHAGAREGRHFSVRVVSTLFLGLSRVQQHRLVYDCLASHIPQGIHALAIETMTPTKPPITP